MRVQRRHHGRPPVVRGAGDPGPRVVVRHVLHQPLHRVPGVRGLVHAASILRVVRRPEHDELALAVESAADVLRYENVVLAAPSLCLRQTHFVASLPDTPYGVRSITNGRAPLAFFGVSSTVWSRTPSRIGIMT